MKKHKLPKGFLASGIHCGVKKKRKDLSLFYSESPCRVAAIFTTNVVKAAPVILAQEQLKKSGHVRAVVVNSGNANCMTGKRGLKDAGKMVEAMAKVLGVRKSSVLVSSTGIIGEPLNMDPIVKGMPKLKAELSADGLMDAAEGIMTTDSFHKISSRTLLIGDKEVMITGVAKGAGMIHPKMATMLCYIMTDAEVSKKALKKALHAAADSSLNAITVDGDMSTNDTVMLLANGKAGNEVIGESGAGYDTFLENLKGVCLELAKMIVHDGEGAKKFIEVNVKGARTDSEAQKVADSVAGSLLVKCAVLGGDPNWGRIASSAGASGVDLDPGKMEIILDGVTFFRNGKVESLVNRKGTSVFKNKEVRIDVDLHSGKSGATVYTCDISKRYITLNSYYTT
jgi:glutamate N-acetyltransferase/amino-acid N-acetyltransferase